MAKIHQCIPETQFIKLQIAFKLNKRERRNAFETFEGKSLSV